MDGTCIWIVSTTHALVLELSKSSTQLSDTVSGSHIQARISQKRVKCVKIIENSNESGQNGKQNFCFTLVFG